MADCLFSDTSEFQVPVNNSYPYSFISFRVCDGTYRDHKFYQNLAWAKQAVKKGKIQGFIVYTVWRPGIGINTLKSMIGTPDPAMAVMIDVESWGGAIRGNHSVEIRKFREDIIDWLNGSRPKATRALYKHNDRKRVISYANAYDRASLFPNWGDSKWIIANYSYNPKLKDQIAHQYTDRGACSPFGHCDMNSADGQKPSEFAKSLGLKPIVVKPVTKPKPVLVPSPHPSPLPRPIPSKAPVFPIAANKQLGEKYPPRYNGKGNLKVRAAIKVVQQKLVKHGFAGKVNAATWCDGIYGHQTAEAVNAFKKSKKWKQDGAVGRVAYRSITGLK